MVSRSSLSERYRQEIELFLEEWAGRGLNAWQQFRNWSVQQVLWEYGLSVAEIEDAVSTDGPRDQGIDAWYYDDTGETPRLILIQAKDSQVARADFSKLRDGFLDVILPNRPGRANQSLREKAATFRDEMPERFRLDMYLTSSVVAQQNLRPSEDGSPLYTEDFSVESSIAEASYYVRDIKYMVDNIQVIHNNPIDCEFNVERNSFFEFFVDGNTRTVCAALKASELANLFHAYRENLFRKNPRYYLLTSANNKAIVGSLKESQNAKFFVYNNGLTCVAYSVAADDRSTEGVVIRVSDFQIVNGCQTVALLWSARADHVDISRVRVLAKIVENPRTGAGADQESEMIALRSNTQNPLKAEDWKANDPRQEVWQQKFQRLPEPWFYEIKRGVWATEYRSAQERAPYRIGQTNQYRKFTLKDLGQVCYAFLGHPAEALDKSREIFNSSTRYDQVFPPDLSPNQLLLPYLIFYEADLLAKERPEFNLPNSDVSVKTAYIRFAIVCAVNRMLSTLADIDQGYLSANDSDHLIATKERWMRLFVEKAFEKLIRKLATESRNHGIGPRSIVRRNEWMDEAIEAATEAISDLMRAQNDAGVAEGRTLAGALPFDVH